LRAARFCDLIGGVRPAISLSVAGLVFRVALTPAWANEPDQRTHEAKLRFQAGQAHFDGGRFDEALREFQAGYELVPRSGFLINIAHSYRRMGNLEEARAYYKRFLLVDPGSPDRAAVEDVIRELDEAIRTTPPPSALPVAAVSSTPAAVATAPPANRPLHRRWWFWSSIAALAVAGIVTAAVINTQDAEWTKDGSIGTLRR